MTNAKLHLKNNNSQYVIYLNQTAEEVHDKVINDMREVHVQMPCEGSRTRESMAISFLSVV